MEGRREEDGWGGWPKDAWPPVCRCPVHTRVHWPPIRGSIARSSIIPYLPRVSTTEVSRRPEHRFFDHIKIHFHAAAHDSTTAQVCYSFTYEGHALLAMKSIPKRARFLRSARSAGNADSIQLPTWEQRGGRGEGRVVRLYLSIYLKERQITIPEGGSFDRLHDSPRRARDFTSELKLGTF